MSIRLKQVIPHPLSEEYLQTSSIWGEDLYWETGDFIQIEAQSGKGKSTLLHIIYGLRFDYDGACELAGETASSFSAEKWRALWINQLSLVFQDLRLFNHLTARQNLELLPEVHSPELNLLEMCEKLTVDHLLDQPVDKLSLGQRQRFALVRSLLKPFKWLLLDEPFSHLDKENAEKAAKLIEHTARLRNAGVIFTSLTSSCPLHFNHSIPL